LLLFLFILVFLFFSLGYTIVCATNEGLYAKVNSYIENTFKFDYLDKSNELLTFESSYDVQKLEETAKEGGFFAYIAGTVAVLLKNNVFLSKIKELSNESTPEVEKKERNSASVNGLSSDIPGLHINNYLTTLPMQKGLSSSASICVLVVSAFSRYYGLSFSASQIMELAYQGEMATPSHCGRMDQCVVMGSNAIALMKFEKNVCSLSRLHCEKSLFFIVINLMSSKDTVKILKDLNCCFPFPKNETQVSRFFFSFFI
jgi:galactokinase